MEPLELEAISDFYKLVVLNHLKITPQRTEYNGRYWGFFIKVEVSKVLNDYDAGRLKVVARDFVSSINRVKDRIFELERANARSGGTNAHTYR